MAVPKKTTTPAAQASPGAGLASLIRDATAGRTGAALALPIAPNYPFFLMHWPSNWQVESVGLKEPTWLPYLSRHTILPGCNLNRTLRQGEKASAAYDQAVLANMRKGAEYLDVERHTVNGGKYLREAPCRDTRNGREGTFYLDAFTPPRDAIPGRRLKFVFDRAAYNKWRLELVLEGVLPPPSRQILEEVIGQKRRRLGRVQGHTNLSKEEYDRRVGAAAELVERFAGAKIPAPKRGRGSRMPSSPGTVPDLDNAAVS